MPFAVLLGLLLLLTGLGAHAQTPEPPLLPPPEPFQPKVEDPLLAPVEQAEHRLKSWDEAERLLQTNSTDERSAAAGVERAQGRWRQALGALLPNARVSAGAAYDLLNPDNPPLGAAAVAAGAGAGAAAGGGTGEGEDARRPTVPLGTGTLNISQSVVDLGAWKGVGSARSARKSAEENLRDVRRRVKQGLARSLVAIVAAERVSELNRLGLLQALERAALTERTRELGAATQVDVVRIRQDVEVARGSLIAGDEQLRRVREALGVALGIPTEVGVTREFALDGLVQGLQRECRAVPWEQRSDLEAAAANVESARRSRQQAARGYLPTLGLTSNLFGLTTDPGFGRFATWNLQAVLTLPLWEGGARGGLVRERRGAESQAAEALEATRRQVAVEVRRARRGVSVSESLAVTARSARAQAAELDALTRRAFSVGRGSSLELVQSAAALRQADVTLATREFELVQARLDALLTEAQCEE
ncbi:MAG TPA: TolC family protein [Myxococcaceae bacterium]|nr:TolC family protein [Myxococcaceae bacterium]